MENILEELWYGNIDPSEQSTGKSQAVKELIKLMGQNRDRLHNSMTAEQRETLTRYDDCVKKCIASWNRRYSAMLSGSAVG